VPGAAARSTLAGKLDRLFEDIRPDGPNGRKYTNAEVAEAIKRANPGLRCSGAYLSALRRGTKRNPSTDLLTALARFFGVPGSYFLDDVTTAQTDAEIDLARVACNLGVRRLAVRALDLSPEGLRVANEMIEQVIALDKKSRSAG